MNPKNYTTLDDKDLLGHFHQDGNNEWLGILLQRYTLMLFGVCMKYMKNEEEAKDCVQQVFLKVLDELKKYEVQYFKSWLYTLARNHCLMKLRNKNLHHQEINEEHTGGEYEPGERTALLEKEHSLDQMEQALTSLTHEQRTCVSLFYLERKSYQEISNITGHSISQVKSHIQNGKRNLRILLQKKPS